MFDNIMISKHTARGQKTSLKKLKFMMKVLSGKEHNVPTVLSILQNAAMVKKSAHILFQALRSCINNAKCEAKQKGLKFTDSGIVKINIGRDGCMKRRMYRAKGSSSPIEKHRAFVSVTITNSIINKDIQAIEQGEVQ